MSHELAQDIHSVKDCNQINIHQMTNIRQDVVGVGGLSAGFVLSAVEPPLTTL